MKAYIFFCFFFREKALGKSEKEGVWAMWKWKTAAAAGWGVLAVLIATVGLLSSHNSVRPQATIQWVQEVPRRPRSFAVLNPEAFRGR